MKIRWVTVTRVALGLIFTVTGLNGFLNFMPAQQLTPEAQSFLGGLFGTGYFLYLLKLTELTSGILLLANRFVPLALLLLAPVIVNIVAYHIFLQPSGALLAVLATACELATAYGYRRSFREVLRARVEPEASLVKDVHPTVRAAS
jgi:uncharacterized membrane protein YphA (DoxX/SURF4 family)